MGEQLWDGGPLLGRAAEAALERARSADRTTVIAMRTDAYTWTEGGSFWEVGVPEVSPRSEVLAARAELEEGKRAQRLGW